MVNRSRAFSEPPIAQLIRRIADNDIEFHVENVLRLVGVDELIGVGFQFATPVKLFLAYSAKSTSSMFPSMLNSIKADIALPVGECGADGVFPVGGLGAVHRPAGEQGCQLCDSNTKELVCENMICSLQLVGHLLLQPCHQPLCYLP